MILSDRLVDSFLFSIGYFLVLGHTLRQERRFLSFDPFFSFLSIHEIKLIAGLVVLPFLW